MKLLISRPLPQSVMDTARARFDLDLREQTAPLSAEEAAAALGAYDAILCTVGDDFRKEAFDGKVRAKLLANFGVGYNHIDVAAAQKAGVAVSNTPGVVTDATADLAITLMLMTMRRAGEGERHVRSGAWEGWNPNELLGTHVTGKRLAIVGMGRIGQAVARRAIYGFNMQVRYHNHRVKGVDLPAVQEPDLHTLLDWADVAVLTVPGAPETNGMIGADELRALGPEGYLVNIARGTVVDEPALIQALEAREIAGAGLDVFAKEPHVPEALRTLDNAVLLPHMGTSTLEVREAMARLALANVIAFAEDRDLMSPV